MSTIKQNLENLEILNLIGRGSQALVYMAKDKQTGQVVALKEFCANGSSVQNFFRELSNVFHLRHRNIIECLNLFYGHNSKHYLVFEYADGGSLRDALVEDALECQAGAVETVMQIASGLAYAHDQGLVHQDLKPENILICLEQGEKVYKISDMGISRRIFSHSEDRISRGSPAYMAPEQFYDTTTSLSDIYSLGIMLYELLTGDLPFMGTATSLFLAHSKEEPDLSKVSDQVLADLLKRMLAKSPDARIPAHEVRDICAAIIHSRDSFDIIDEEVFERGGKRSSEIKEPVIEAGQVGIFKQGTIETLPAQRIFYCGTSEAGALFLTDGRSTDYLECSTKRFYYHYFNQGTQSLGHPDEKGVYSVGTSKAVYMFHPQKRKMEYGFHLMTPPLMVDSTRAGHVLVADERKLTVFNPRGGVDFSAPVSNYFINPLVLVLDEGIMISTGPVRPALRLYHFDGTLKYSIKLPGPCVALSSLAGCGVIAVVIGLSQDEPARILKIGSEQKEILLEFSKGASDGLFCGELIALICQGGEIHIYTPEATLLGVLSLQGAFQSACFDPHRHLLYVLTLEKKRFWLTHYQLQAGDIHPVSQPLKIFQGE